MFIRQCCCLWTVKKGSQFLGYASFLALIVSVAILPFIWEIGLLGIFISFAPAFSFVFVLRDDSSKNRRFFYRAFVLSMVAFYTCIIVGLLTLKGSFGAYCLHNLTRSPSYATMTPEEVTYFLSNCESKIQLWGIIGGIASLIVFVHYAVVLKQNYMNRLPLSQAIAEATRNSRVNSLNRRS